MGPPLGSHFYIGLHKGKHDKILFETTSTKALILSMYHYLGDHLFKLCPWGQNWTCHVGHMFYIGLHRENMIKSSCKKRQGLKA